MTMFVSREKLLNANPKSFLLADLPQHLILEWFRVMDAGWLYNGEPDPSKPHAQLASGLCSNGYFNCRKVLCYPNLNEILAFQLVRKLKEKAGRGPCFVLGSPYSAITFSYEIARIFGVPHLFAEKDPTDPTGKKMIFKEEIPEGSWVMQIEELITTLGTAQEVRRAVLASCPHEITILPEVGTCIHRPDKLPAATEDRQIVSLVETAVSTWKPEDCPYCRVGSARVKPKANWAQLVGTH